MGKLLRTEDGEHFDNIHLGCISGVFPVLDYQKWHSNVKKMLPHRKHARQQKTNGGILHDRNLFETSKGKRSLIWAGQRSQKHNSHPRSIKDRLKSLVSEETFKDGHKKRGRKLQRTYSIHHLETDEWVHVDSTILNSQNGVKEPDENDTEIEDYVDISEDSKINKNILLDGSQVSLTKAKLTTSSSFPSMLGSRNLRPTKLKHKLNEFYLRPKNEKGPCNWARKLDLSKLESLMVELDQQDGKNLDDGLKNGCIMSMKRTCSLDEHSNMFTQLFESCDTKETILYDKSNVLCNDFYEEEEEGGPKTEIKYSNSSLQEESQQLEFQISKGLKPLCFPEDDAKNNIKILNINTHDHNDECFNYVKEILERSGFIKNGIEQTWYASNQPLNPSMFQEIESQYTHDPQCFKEELTELCSRLHRFELVDEILLKLYERSFSDYPEPLSCSCHLTPAPSGKHVLEEVWKNISRMLNMKTDMDESLESIVGRDLREGDEWMNLQMESESIALELEDMIFDELLGEVVCS